MTTWLKVDAAVTALLANITTKVNALPFVPDESVLICEGPPAGSQYQPLDLVVVAERIEHQPQPHALVGTGGPGWLTEEFRISVVVDVFRLGGADPSDVIAATQTAAAVRSRCLLLTNAVFEGILSDPSLGGAVFMAYPETNTYTSDWDENGKGRRARTEIQVLCRAIP